MENTWIKRFGWQLPCLALAGWALLVSSSAGAVSLSPADLKDKLHQAELLEAKGDWAKACEIYDELLRLERGSAKYRRLFHNSFRRLQQNKRHADSTYNKEVVTLPISKALDLYQAMLESIQKHHVEKANAGVNRLFQRGLEEFRFAIENAMNGDGGQFRSDYLPAVKTVDLEHFVSKLNTWKSKKIKTIADAVEQVRFIAMAAQKSPSFGGLDLNATLVALEFACGACTALDEFSFYLTPGQLSALSAALKGSKTVGVGLEITVKDDRVVVSRVLRGSPAEDKGIRPGDLLTHVGKKPTSNLTAELVQELLKGECGSAVELEVSTDGMETRTVTLIRRKITPRSVEFGWLWEKSSMSMESARTDIGYIQITNFLKTTPGELDNAIASLKEGGMKGLILDLRGNTGGSFEASVNSARRFLSSGVIVTTQKNNAKLTKHMVRNGALLAPLTVPMVVLVDGNTASSAEVLAGALKYNGRCKLVGQTTFGKVCSQRVLRLTIVKGGPTVGGIRITVAKFLSPTGQPYTGKGINPHLFAQRYVDANQTEDNQLTHARRLVEEEMRNGMNNMRM